MVQIAQISKPSGNDHGPVRTLRRPLAILYGTQQRLLGETTMTYQNKTQPGLVGYVLILVIFASLAAPALLPGV